MTHVPYAGRLMPVPSLLPSTKVVPVTGWPRMTYMRPLASTGIRVAFERYDGEYKSAELSSPSLPMLHDAVPALWCPPIDFVCTCVAPHSVLTPVRHRLSPSPPPRVRRGWAWLFGRA